jgi:hypothetical protein
MTMITGKENVEFASILALRSALRLEVKTGMTLSRGQSALAIAKKRGLTKKGTKAGALEDLNAYLAEYGF